VSPSRTDATGPEKSAAITVVGMSKAASSRNDALCGTIVLARWRQIAITVRVNEELERGCTQGILQIVGEEVQPGKRE